MQFVLGGISFVAFMGLVRWGLDMNWPLAVIAGAVWSVAVTSLVRAARDRHLSRIRMSGFTWLAAVLTNFVALLGVHALDLPTPEYNFAAGILVLAVGAANVALGMLGAAAVVKPEK
ncbi:hypothetical protein [Symbiobacterium terraclitae]|uniref:hypothetical protein n=1 Tax=Symbiobacterium terraclitae TaxID=557451 RepID=UPI0035B51994